MNLAKVLGTVVASQKEEALTGLKLLMLGQAGPDGELTGGVVVAVDAVVMAIVDSWDTDGEVRYTKGQDG
jgi:microcompartment protein CcmK/EutM|nr:EutN/CcmL family microcompartment protein [Candidatus Krumholzibacteria bacterium]